MTTLIDLFWFLWPLSALLYPLVLTLIVVWLYERWVWFRLQQAKRDYYRRHGHWPRFPGEL